MEQEENEFYQDHREEFENIRGHSMASERSQSLNEPPPTRSRFTRQAQSSAVEPELELSKRPEHSELNKEAIRFPDLKERLRRHRERLEAESAKSDHPDQFDESEPKEEQKGGSHKNPFRLPVLPESLSEMTLGYEILCGQLQEVLALPPEEQNQKDIIKEWRKILLRHEKLHKEMYPSWLRKEFRGHFKKDEDRWPTKWMLDNKKIRERLDEEEVLKREIAILNYLWKHRIDDRNECIELADHIGAGKLRKIETQTRKNKQGKVMPKKEVPVERDFVFIGELDFKKMQKELGKGYSPSYVKQHMEESARVGILEKFRKSGPNGQMVYAIGYWSPMGKGRFRAESFLMNDKDKKFREVLQEFTLPCLKEG